MSLDTQEEVDQFLALSDKNELELRAICEGLSLEPAGSKEEMVENIMASGVKPQVSVLVPQAIPLRTRDNHANALEGAGAAMQKWRKLIFDAKGNRKTFHLLNSDGETYTAEMKYVRCSIDTLHHILDHEWYLPLENNQSIISALKQDPESFEACIVRKPDSRGNSWLMLHVRKAA